MQQYFSVPFITGFSLLVIWSLIWKGLALWKSARNQHIAWFIVMFLLNTAGILEIIYLLMHRDKKNLAK